MVEQVHPIPLALRTHDFPKASVTHYHTDSAYGFVTDHDPRRKPHEGESQELIWCTANELRELTNDDAPADVRTIGLHLLLHLNEYIRIPADSYSV